MMMTMMMMMILHDVMRPWIINTVIIVVMWVNKEVRKDKHKMTKEGRNGQIE